ncbi:unnamed protein product, partial [Effrenium voratum]
CSPQKPSGTTKNGILTNGLRTCVSLKQTRSLRAEALLWPNVISYSSAISACEKGSQPLVALQLLDDMDQDQVLPDVICFNAAISACETPTLWPLALSLFQ